MAKATVTVTLGEQKFHDFILAGIRQQLGEFRGIDRFRQLFFQRLKGSNLFQSFPFEVSSREDAEDAAQKLFGICAKIVISEEFVPPPKGQDLSAGKLETDDDFLPPEDLPQGQHKIGLKGGNLKAASEQLSFTPSMEESQIDEKIFFRSIYTLGLPTRIENWLTKKKITTIGTLVACTADGLLTYKYFGKASLAEVREKLAEFGLKLRDD